MLHLHLSNRVSIFIDQLIDILEKSPRPQVLARRHVVVPSMLVAKYLNLQLAQKQGIAANIQYLLPAEYIWKALADLQLELPAQAQFESSVLHWRIYAWLCKAENIQNYSELNSYLDPSPSSRRRTFQLAAEVAGLFNKYLIYRADLLYQWQRKRDQSDWQAALWFDLRQKAAEAFWGDLPELLAVIDFSQLPFSNLLSQATVFFGVADFSPGYLAVLEKIAGISELHLMLMNPSSYYWGDDLSTKTRSLHELMLAQRGQDSQLSYLDEGNRLLASLGQHRDQQFDLIWSLNPQEIDAYEPPTGSSLLSLLQQNLYEPGEVATQAYAKPINSDDQSLLIHSCHSPLRELQVLYDYLLDCFQTMPELQMHEVLVVVPQLDQYAGFIPSVFKYGAGPSMGFCISDSQDSFLQSVRDILHKLLTLNQKLLDVTWLNDVLHYPLIRANFELTQQDLSKLQFYMEKLAIYWGVDGAELAQQELPQHLNTWDAGIQRWMLGYAMGDVSPNMFNDLLPMPDVDPGDSDLFSKFLLFYNKLLQLKSNLLEARSIEEWRQTCQQMVDDFFYFEADELVAKIQLNQALDQLVQASESAQFSEVLPLPVFIQALEQIFATRQANIVLHQDAIVFAAPHQVNNIEFKVIAMLGMNADAYPRPQTQLIFDHSLQDKRLGDANPRDLDRDYFLQCLVNCRDYLHLSFVGQHHQDNSQRPMSNLIAELLDYMDSNFEIEGAPSGQSLSQQICIKHKIHGFDSDYFKSGSRLFSYSQAWAQAARHFEQSGLQGKVQFANGPVQTPDSQEINIQDMLIFFRDPSAYFLKQQYGIDWREYLNLADAEEPLLDDKLNQYQLKQAIEQFARPADLHDKNRLKTYLQNQGLMPMGAVDEFFLQQQLQYFHKLEQEFNLDRIHYRSLQLNIELGTWRISGLLNCIDNRMALFVEYGKFKAHRLLSAWIKFLCQAAMQQECNEAYLLCTDKQVSMQLKSLDVLQVLGNYAELFMQGQQQLTPFFTQTSYDYASEKKPENRLSKARKTWLGGFEQKGEAESLSNQLLYDETILQTSAFEGLAHLVYDDIIQHCKLSNI